MKGIKITVMMLVFCQAVVAQSKTVEEVATKHVERLDSKVQLTTEQKVDVQTIILASTQDMRALKESGTASPEDRKAIKKAEREKIKEILTAEQKTKLKEARHADAKPNNEVRMEKRAKREKRNSARSAMHEKRAAFDNNLSAQEKEAIDKARSLQPAKIKGKEAREALTTEEKEARKAQRKEVHKLLRPVVKAHEAELAEIQASLPAKGEPSQSAEKEGKKRKKGFAYKFLLMK